MRFRVRNLEEWHPWFAWYPVIIRDEIVWLEVVNRRRVDIGHMWGDWKMEYN
jgi:hypothetical protein